MRNSINLTAAERAACAAAFSTFDKDMSGTIDSAELKQVLNALGRKPTDSEVFNMVASWDEDDSGEIELEEFMAIFSMAKENEQRHDDTDTLAAFVAMGGNDDFTGRVSVQKLLATIQEFELVVDLGAMLQKADRDNSGHIDYSEFKMLLSH